MAAPMSAKRSRQRRHLALSMRLGGETYRAIGAALEVSAERARQMCEQEMSLETVALMEDAEKLRRTELLRLEKLMIPFYKKAEKGDGLALDRVLKIMERRARLVGLDVQTGEEPVQRPSLDLRGKTPEQLHAIGQLLALAEGEPNGHHELGPGEDVIEHAS